MCRAGALPRPIEPRSARDPKRLPDAPPRLNHFFSGFNSSDAEFMQYRKPVGAGPSSNTCPRCASQRAQRASVRTMP